MTTGDEILVHLRARFPKPFHSAPPREKLPDVPTVAALGAAIDATRNGRAEHAHALAELVLATATSADPDLIGAAEQLLRDRSPGSWPTFDEALRGESWSVPNWMSVLVERLTSRAPTPLELVLAASHSSGYVREAAVALMDGQPLFGPVLALRAADWVPKVRERARTACERWLADAPGTALPALAPTAFVLDRRVEGRWLAETVLAVLRDGPADVLDAGLAAADRRLRRAAYRTALATGRIEADRLLRAALTDPDLTVRTDCAEALIRRDPGSVRPLLASRTAAIRADAVHAVALAGDTAPAHAALLDRASVVRATAQAAVRRAGPDPAETYRALLGAGGTPDPAAIAGLGETGVPADSGLLWPWLVHPLPRGRAFAVRALYRLGAPTVPAFVPLLSDPSPAVVRQAKLALLGKANSIDESLLWTLVDAGRPRATRVAAAYLLRARDTWTRIAVDLSLLTDPELCRTARTDLANWLISGAATTYATPTGARRTQIGALLTAAGNLLGADELRKLRFHADIA